MDLRFAFLTFAAAIATLPSVIPTERTRILRGASNDHVGVDHRLRRPTRGDETGRDHSPPQTHTDGVPHVRTSVRGLIKTGRSPHQRSVFFSFLPSPPAHRFSCEWTISSQRHGPQQEIRGSVVERSAVCLLFTFAAGHNDPTLCHPARSGGICDLPSLHLCCGALTALPFVIPTGGVMGLGPRKVMKSTFCSATTLPWKHRPPLCHLDRSAPGFPTSRCWLLPRVRLSLKRAACRSSKPRISTGNPGSVVERSLCGCFFLGMFFDRGVMGLWPTQGDEKRLLFSNHSAWKHRPTLCHLDRSAPGFPTSRCWLLPRVRLSFKESRMQILKATGLNRKSGERSGEICGSAVPSWTCVFDRAHPRDLQFLPA